MTNGSPTRLRMPTLGARIRQARRAAGLTQAGLAVRVGVSTTTLHKIEVGRIPDPRLSTVVKIADVLQVCLVALAGQAAGAVHAACPCAVEDAP